MRYIIMIILALFISGCSDLVINQNFGNEHYQYEEMQSINEYMGKNVTMYKEKFLDGQVECISGNCEPVEFKNETKEKECYFCDIPLLTEKKLNLNSESWQSGSSDFSFGCSRKWGGEEKNGFEIISQNENRLVVRGDISLHFQQKSFTCNKTNDPECDDMTYGTCSGDDYEMRSTRTVEMAFE